ncbi:Conserved_hypothetical protein [Hexamita inflata]|uniref:Uncharacterized protein n=1 Tax=Hexamita inflata TaxID=28002 RepID=A0AA86PKE3_9EUKA|nr:Conserved hypothetical protein [Hexamita inflata]
MRTELVLFKEKNEFNVQQIMQDEQRILDLQDLINQHQSTITEKQNQIDAQQLNISDLTTKLDLKAEELQIIQTDIKCLQQQHKKRVQELIQTTQNQTTQYNEDINALKSIIIEKTNQIQQSKSEFEIKLSKLELKHQQDLNTQIEKVQTNLGAEINKLQVVISDLHQKFEEQRHQFSLQVQKCQIKHQSEEQTLKNALKKLHSVNTELGVQMKQNEEQRVELQSQLYHTNNYNNDLKENLTKTVVEANQQLNTIQQQRKLITSLKSEIIEVQERKNKLEDLHLSQNLLNSKIQDQELLNQKDKQINTLSIKNSHLEAQLTKLTQQNQQICQQLQNTKQQQNSYLKDTYLTQIQLSELSSTKSQVHDLKNCVQSLIKQKDLLLTNVNTNPPPPQPKQYNWNSQLEFDLCVYNVLRYVFHQNYRKSQNPLMKTVNKLKFLFAKLTEKNAKTEYGQLFAATLFGLFAENGREMQIDLKNLDETELKKVQEEMKVHFTRENVVNSMELSALQ